MNNGLKIISLVIVSALLIFLVDFFSGGKVIEEKQLPPDEVVKEFGKKGDSIASSSWNKSNYNRILDEFQTYRDQKAINTADGAKIESFLEVCYAKSLLNSFEDWQKSKGVKSMTNLLTEISQINQIPECKAILQKPLEILKQYNLAIQLPTNIDNLLSQPYNIELCEKAKANIVKICSYQGISTFPSIQAIKISQPIRVSEFEKFALDYIATRNLWQEDPVEFSSTFMNYCPDGNSDISKYAFYLNEFNNLDICP